MDRGACDFQVHVLLCRQCGAPVDFELGKITATCAHCNTKMAVMFRDDRKDGKTSVQNGASAVKPNVYLQILLS